MAAGVRRAAAALRRQEGGLTLIELLVASTLGLVVVGAAMTVFIGVIRSEPRTTSKVTAIQQARVTLDRITRELRQGQETTVSTPSELAIVTYVKAASCAGGAGSTSIPCQVTYICSGSSCTRQVSDPDGSLAGPVVQVASGLTGSPVFSYLPDEEEPTYIGVSLALETGGAPVTLGDGVALRNSEEAEGA
jgi:Tfp pilus assembly protein PilW